MTQRKEFAVWIIMTWVSVSETSIPRLRRTVPSRSASRSRLLAAPLSWVNLIIENEARFPCSMTVKTSAAKESSFAFRSIFPLVLRTYSTPSDCNLQLVSPILANIRLRCLSTTMSVNPNCFHPLKTVSSSLRALPLETVQQRYFLTGFTLKSLAIQLCCGSIWRALNSRSACESSKFAYWLSSLILSVSSASSTTTLVSIYKIIGRYLETYWFPFLDCLC